MRIHRQAGTVAVAATAAWALLASAMAAAATGRPATPREVLASTTPVAGPHGSLSALPLASPVQVSVFTGARAGLAAAALAAADPASPGYQHYLTPAQVRARYGATAAQQSLVAGIGSPGPAFFRSFGPHSR